MCKGGQTRLIKTEKNFVAPSNEILRTRTLLRPFLKNRKIQLELQFDIRAIFLFYYPLVGHEK